MYTSSLAFQSFQNSLSSANAQRPEPVTRITPLAPVVPIRPAESTTTLATHLSTLLNQLGWDDVPAAQSTLTSFQTALSRQSTPDNALGSLLSRLSTTLSSGTSQQALAQVQTFLLSAGQATGTSFSARV